MTARERWGVLLAVLAAFSFSTLGVWGKLAAATGLPSETLLAWRFGIVAAALSAAGSLGRSLPGRTRLLLLGFGLAYMVQTSFFFAALEYVSAVTTGLLLYVCPAFVVLYAWLLGRRPEPAQLLAILVASSGLVIVIGLPGPADRSAVGIAFALAAAASYGGYLLASERLLRGLPPFTVTAHLSLGSVAGFALLGAAGGRLRVPSGLDEWALVGAVTVVPTLVALPAMFGAISRVGAARTAILLTLEPAFTLLVAWAALGEPLGAAQLIGGALILTGAALAQRPGPEDAPAATPA